MDNAKKPQWPNDHPFVLGLSHDVDRVRKRMQFLYYLPFALLKGRVSNVRREVESLAALLRGDDPYWNFERIMALEDGLGVRSTCFFMDEQGQPTATSLQSQVLYRGRYTLDEPKIQAAIQQLDQEGWEIGLHGSYCSFDTPALFKQEKNKLETIIKHPVQGTRQHYLRLQIPETWRMHEEAGLTYDSTLGYANQIGWRWNKRLPFYPTDPATGEEINVLQIPMTIMDTPLLQCNHPWKAALSLIDEAEAKGSMVTLNWHQRVFNSWDMAVFQEMYIQIIRECQARGAWIVPLGRVAKWWTESVGEFDSTA